MGNNFNKNSMPYLSKTVGLVGTRTVQQDRMEENGITLFHFDPYTSITIGVIVDHTVVHFIHSTLNAISIKTE